MEIKTEIIHAMGDFMGLCAEMPLESNDKDTIEMANLVIGQLKTASLMVKCITDYEGAK